MYEMTPLHDVTAAAGADFTEDAGWIVPRHFGDAPGEYHQARKQAALFDVSPRSRLQLRGPDAAKFLHGLCSNDILGLAPGDGCEAFLLNVKARVVGHVFVSRLALGDGETVLWLDTAPGQAPKVRDHLDHFLISEDVEITVRSDLAQLHLAGPRAADALERLFGAEVRGLREHQHLAGQFRGDPVAVTLRRLDRLGVPGFDLVCLPLQAPELWRALTDGGARPAGLEAYEALRLEAGTPVYGKDIDESHLGPEVGRTAQAISYKKGCYLGQEPVCRIRDLGQVNRTLMGLKVAGKTAVPHEARLLRDGAEVGRVMSSAFSPGLGLTVALAYVRRGSQRPGTPVEVEAGDERRSAEVVALPFGGSGAGP
jgi:folate-binding protein YgfZ